MAVAAAKVPGGMSPPLIDTPFPSGHEAIARATPDSPDAPSTPAPSEVPTFLRGRRALLVDGAPKSLLILEHVLQPLGVETIHAADAFDALAELERARYLGSPYDMVLLDRTMPGLSGDRLAERIRATPTIAETKLVMISAAEADAVDEPAAGTIDCVLSKPIRRQSLLDGLGRLFGGTAAERQPSPPPPPAATPSANGGPANDAPQMLRILVAEDNEVNQRLAATLLGRAGHTVHLAANGLEAVHTVETEDLDVVLMDIQMPVLDGVQATMRIRKLPSAKATIPIIALTAHAMAGMREEYLAAGMNDFIAKPFNPRALLARLAEIRPAAAAPDETAAPPPASPEKAAPVAEPILDAEVIGALRSMLDGDEFDELMAAFMTGQRERMQRCQALLAAADLAELAREAHNLIGTAGNLGARRTSADARALETAAKSGDAPAVRLCLERLEASSNEAMVAAQIFLETHKQTA